MKKKSIIIFFCVVAAVAAAAVLAGSGLGGAVCGQEVEDEALSVEPEKIMYDTIPLEKRIARMFVVGLDSCALKTDDPIIRKIQELGVGGVVLFGHNIPAGDSTGTSQEKLARLCAELQGLAEHELMIGIDQEGGRVRRLREENGYEFMPSHAFLGKVDDEDTTRFYAGRTARLLDDVGINVNFAPCADVNINPSCPAIGKFDRSFSTDPEAVQRHVSYFIDEHRRHGVVTAMKHFPGPGSSAADSHNGLTDVSKTWQESELIPFRNIINEDGCDMIMVGHIFNSRLDPDYPASLSEATVEDLLRYELGWDGLVVSDDLGMKAINDNYSLNRSLQLCINAGVDMIMLIAHDSPERLEAAIDNVCLAVCDGLIPEARINESYLRIERVFHK